MIVSHDGLLRFNPGPLQKQPVLVNTKSFLQPQVFRFLKNWLELNGAEKVHSIFFYRQVDVIKIIHHAFILLKTWHKEHILVYIYIFVCILVLKDAQLLQSDTQLGSSLLTFVILMTPEPLKLFTLSLCKCVCMYAFRKWVHQTEKTENYHD